MRLWIKVLTILISNNSNNMKFRTNFHGIFMDFIKIPWKSIKIPCNIEKNFLPLTRQLLKYYKNKLHNINK